jgi:hypothetical protein
MTTEQITNSYYSQEFESINEELRIHFGTANNEIEKAKEKVNVLVVLVHNDNPKWSVKKICDYIAGKNDDLEDYGFTSKTIYNYLNEENRQLVNKNTGRPSKSKPKFNTTSKTLEDIRNTKGTIVQNNVLEESFESVQTKVPEESSRTKLHKNDYNNEVTCEKLETVIEGKEEYEEDEYTDNYEPQKQVWRLEAEIARLKTPFEYKISPVVKGQELPFIVKVDPYKRTITSIEVDQKQVKKQIRF